MAVRTSKHPPNGIFYITFTCSKWLPLFDITNSYDLVYQWFDWLKSEGHYVFSYVIMPNHLHCMIGLTGHSNSVNKIVANAKRLMAYEIVKRLQESNRTDMLNEINHAVSQKDKKRGKLHQVFEPSFDCKECFGEDFILQKLNYIHNNPVKGKWRLVSNPIDYLHSSARYYATGVHACYPVDNIHARHDLKF